MFVSHLLLNLLYCGIQDKMRDKINRGHRMWKTEQNTLERKGKMVIERFIFFGRFWREKSVSFAPFNQKMIFKWPS
jgi:hypothetical protein